MDREGNSREDLRGALRDIRHVNRHLGGGRALLAALRPILDRAATDRALEVLDVGTGDGDLPLQMIGLARALGRRCVVTALERDPGTAAIAVEETRDTPGVQVVRADAFLPPFGERSFDVVTASLFLHHFDEARIVELLAGWRRLARTAVIVNDLRRHRLPWAFVLVTARLTRRHPMFVHDAPLSVLRGFTAAELRELAGRSGAESFTVKRRWPFRLVLELGAGGPT